MNIPLSRPVATIKRVTVEQSELQIEYITLNPQEDMLRIKVTGRPEISVAGPKYLEIKPALEKALGKILTPLIDAAVQPATPSAETPQL